MEALLEIHVYRSGSPWFTENDNIDSCLPPVACREHSKYFRQVVRSFFLNKTILQAINHS